MDFWFETDPDYAEQLRSKEWDLDRVEAHAIDGGVSAAPAFRADE